MEFIDAKKNNFNLSYFGVKMSFVDACYDVLASLGQPFVFAIEVSEAWVSVQKMRYVLTFYLCYVSAHLFRSVSAWESLHSVPLQPTLGFLLGVWLEQRATGTVGEGSRIPS